MNACPICLEPSETVHAACCRSLYGSVQAPTLSVALADLERLALETVNRRLSVPGVQRKLSLSCLGEEGGRQRLTIVAALGGSHILKPPTAEYPGMPELEHWTMRLAARCGIDVAESGLVPLASGEMAFVVRRFDREKGRRIAVEDVCQLLGQPTADKYRSSLERVGTAIRKHATTPGQDALGFFDRVVFCFLTGNSDMHLKNWSLVCDRATIALSPAYDLLPTRLLLSDPEESALPLNGRKSKLAKRDFLALASHLRLPGKVAQQRLASLPEALTRAIAAIPSPWVAPHQATAFVEHVQTMSERLREP